MHYKKSFFYSHGKLLLTGEYVILFGALGVALPTVKGQLLTVIENKDTSSILHWKSYDKNHNIWFEAIFRLPYLEIFYNTEKNIAIRLRNLLLKSKKIKKKFLKESLSIYVNTYLQFSIDWGLGSSSTLINNIAKWANINPFELLDNENFPGSGYDIACVSISKPIIYKYYDTMPFYIPINFNPPFKNKLFFLHLNKKQNTTKCINLFRYNNIPNKKIIESISFITWKVLFCKKLNEFEELLLNHEKIISKILNLPTIKEIYFPDYLGLVKSLGAWGGDFVLISFRKGMKKYFSKKGFNTIISFDKMIF
ncbi:GYDIA family GHMP kinase [Blattabacterium cuenoti]|uniref:GYDIA family GHMP kinase n=1 Tax=Blattabacterium cuenoti TaxID=1653831 RepID=UPI00163CCB53|nr:GYDIA family GHMP kinase [Blattabacterium cuenoti]